MNKMHKLKGTVLDIQINLASSSLKIWLTNWRQMKYIRACTVDEALELAKIKQPDVIFLKAAFMPTSGFKIYEILQKNQDTKHIPVVFYNGRNPDVEKQMKESGVPYILQPPTDLDKLFECLATYLEVVEDQPNNPRHARRFKASKRNP